MKRIAMGLVLLTAAWWLPADGVLGSQEVETNNTAVRPLIEADKVWTLSVSYDMPRFVTVRVPNKGRTMYWYMTYQLANRTGQERRIVPRFELVTNTDKVYPGVVAPEAERRIRLREITTQKLLSLAGMVGMIPPFDKENGDTVKSGMAIFESPDPKTDRFSIFISGLSNGFRKEQITDPDTGEVSYQYKFKTLKLNFVMPGDEYYPDENEIRMAPDVPWEWVYR